MGLPEVTLTGDRRFDPRTLGGCCFWIHADAYLHDGSGNVTVMLDQSGLNNDMYQSVLAQQVTVQKSTFAFNGKATFVFSNTLKFYERVGINAIRGFPYGQTPSTTFAVFSRSTIPNAFGFEATFYWQKGDATPDISVQTDADGLLQSASQGILTDFLTSAPVNTAFIFGLQYNNSSMYHFKDGVPGAFTNATGNFGGPTNPRIRIGNASGNAPPVLGDRGFQGNLAEIIVFNRFLSPNERALVFNQLGAYYDIPVASAWGGALG